MVCSIGKGYLGQACATSDRPVAQYRDQYRNAPVCRRRRMLSYQYMPALVRLGVQQPVNIRRGRRQMRGGVLIVEDIPN
jgi:hypothetical protein